MVNKCHRIYDSPLTTPNNNCFLILQEDAELPIKRPIYHLKVKKSSHLPNEKLSDAFTIMGKLFIKVLRVHDFKVQAAAK